VSTTGWLIVGLVAGVLWAVQFGATVALMGRVERIVGQFDDAVNAWVEYAEQLKAERDQYAADLKAAVATNTQLVATDAATDAEQAAALQAQLTAQLTGALEKLQAAPSEGSKPKDKPVLGPGKQPDKPEYSTVPYVGPKDLDKPPAKTPEKPEFPDPNKGELKPEAGKVTEKPGFADPGKGDKPDIPKTSK
jgi:hypothetical protein